MAAVDQFESHRHHDWWANSTTCLASVKGAVDIAVTDAGWTASGRLRSDDEEEVKGSLSCATGIRSLRSRRPHRPGPAGEHPYCPRLGTETGKLFESSGIPLETAARSA